MKNKKNVFYFYVFIIKKFKKKKMQGLMMQKYKNKCILKTKLTKLKKKSELITMKV